MKLAFVVNRVETEQSDYTTIRLARKAAARGHELAFISLGDFIYEASGRICAMATVPKTEAFDDDTAYLEHLQNEAPKERIVVEDFDIVMLRSDPADELVQRPWAPSSSLLFAQLAAAHGTIVLNDPSHLTDAVNKTYFQHFPEEVRPATCITRQVDEVVAFLEEHGGKGVIKPLQGSGGQGVFIVDKKNRQNLNQIVESVTRDGYAIVQEYLPAAADGDLRIITLNGRPLRVDDTYASPAIQSDRRPPFEHLGWRQGRYGASRTRPPCALPRCRAQADRRWHVFRRARHRGRQDDRGKCRYARSA